MFCVLTTTCIQACKAIYETTSQRIVWIHALDRIVRPTLSIADMSMAELECVATASMRWIALSSSEDRNDDGLLPRRATRTIKNPVKFMMDALQINENWRSEVIIDLFLVPGGCCLVASTTNCVGVWDLGYISGGNVSTDGESIKIWVRYMDGFLVHPTLDGLGVQVLAYSSL